MARHWAEVGFGTPVVMHLFYVFKILLYILFAWVFAVLTTRGLALTDIVSWYAEPVVFEKVVLYTMLFEVIGLGCGFGPLNNRFNPPMGSILYWLGPVTIRLAPWAGSVPGNQVTVRTDSCTCCDPNPSGCRRGRLASRGPRARSAPCRTSACTGFCCWCPFWR